MTTSISATTAANQQPSQDFYRMLMEQRIDSTRLKDMQAARRETITTKNPTSTNLKETLLQDSSLLVTTPEEIKRNLDQWRKDGTPLHIVV